MKHTDATTALVMYVRACDAARVTEWLLGASPDERAAARRTFGNASAVATAMSAAVPQSMAYDSSLSRAKCTVGSVLAVALSGPAAAVKGVDRVGGFDWTARGPLHARHLADLVIDRGAEWAATFVRLASALPLNRWREPFIVYQVVRAVVDALDLPTPTGSIFARGWCDRIGPGAEPTYELELARDDARFSELFRLALSTDAFGRQYYAGFVPGYVHRLIGAGILSRDDVVAFVVDLLPAQRAVGTQRVLAGLLDSLAVTPAELPRQWPALRGIIGTAHGSVGMAVLPAAIAAVQTPDDVAELAATLIARPEKKQRHVLVRALTSPELRRRLGAAAVTAGLRTLSGAAPDDPRLGALVDAALLDLGVDDDVETGTETGVLPVRTGLWDDAPKPRSAYAAKRLGEWPGLDADRLRWLGDPGSPWSDRPDLGPAFVLAAIVREGARSGAEATWQILLPALAGPRLHREPLLEALADAHPELSGLAYEDAVRRARATRPVGSWWLTRPLSLHQPHEALRYLLAREAMLRLGRHACLLSTPSHDDGTISFEALVPRIELNQGADFGPLDLFQTLLRLCPVSEADLSALEGLRLPLDDSVVPADQPCLVPDAVEAIRTWVRAGGLPMYEPDPHGKSWSPLAPKELPIPVEHFGSVPPYLFQRADRYNYRYAATYPRWPDLFGGSLDRRFLRTEIFPGRYARHRMLMALCCADRDEQQAACEVLVRAVAQGTFDLDAVTDDVVTELREGTLSLVRLVRAFETLAYSGVLSVIWPIALELARVGTALPRKPAGLGDLLRLLSELAAEVPDLVLPDEIVDLATSRGTTQSHLRARELLDAVTALRAAA